MEDLDNFNPKEYLWSFPRQPYQDDLTRKDILIRDIANCIKYYTEEVPELEEAFTLESLVKIGIENFHKLILTLLAQYPGWFRKDMTVFNFIDLLGKFMQEPSSLRDKDPLDLYRD